MDFNYSSISYHGNFDMTYLDCVFFNVLVLSPTTKTKVKAQNLKLTVENKK